jgi:hypothetical protein
MIEKTQLVSGETCVIICIEVSRAVIVGKFNTGTDRLKESDRDI